MKKRLVKTVLSRQMKNRSKYSPDKCKNIMANYRRLKKSTKE